jgi:ATP-dependent Zn protease
LPGFFRRGEAALDAALIRPPPQAAGRGDPTCQTFQAPRTDQYGYSAAYLHGRITGALGGRAAEEVIYGDATTGAEHGH